MFCFYKFVEHVRHATRLRAAREPSEELEKNIKKKRIGDRSTHSKKAKHTTAQRSEDIGKSVGTRPNKRDIAELPNVIFPFENKKHEPTGTDSNPFRNVRSSKFTFSPPSDGNDSFSSVKLKVEIPSPSSSSSHDGRTLKRKHYLSSESDTDNDETGAKTRKITKNDDNLGSKTKFLCPKM